MTEIAQRVQRLRTKGFKLQEASRSGLPVKYVGRPTKWGNPFKLSPDGWILYYKSGKLIGSPWCYWSVSGGFKTKDIVELYEQWINGELQKNHPHLPIPPSITELRDKDLACFCSLDKQCHVDVILKIINSQKDA